MFNVVENKILLTTCFWWALKLEWAGPYML